MMSPIPGWGEQRKPHPSWGERGRGGIAQGHLWRGGIAWDPAGSQAEQWDGWTSSSAVRPGPCQVSRLEGSGQPVLPVQPPTAGGGITGMLLAPVPPPPSLTPAPLLCPSAREQLRRSRHSRTFLVESGVGELWSEMQAGRRGDGQCTPPQQTPSRRRFTGGGDRTSRSPHRCCLAPRVTLGERMGGWMYPPVAEPPRDPQRGPASTRGGSCRGGDTAPVCHSVPAPRRMLVRVGGGCLPPSRPTVPSKHRNVPLLPSKTSSAFFLGGGQTPIFWLNRGGGGIPWGKRSPAAHSRVPAAPPNPRDGCPRGSALLRCWGTPHSGWGGTRDPHSALVRARR